MRGEDLFIWLLVALLIAGIAVTLICSPRGSRHGYGSLSEIVRPVG